MERLDNSPEARRARQLAWQHVLPRVVEFEPASPLSEPQEPVGNVVDLNANVRYMEDYRGGPRAA